MKIIACAIYASTVSKSCKDKECKMDKSDRDKDSDQEQDGSHFAWGKTGDRIGGGRKFKWQSSIKISASILAAF